MMVLYAWSGRFEKNFGLLFSISVVTTIRVVVWYGMVWCPSYPPSMCSVTEGGGVMQRGPIRSVGSVSNTDRQCNPRLFGDGFVLVTLAMEKIRVVAALNTR
jgi:hypothetical protein